MLYCEDPSVASNLQLLRSQTNWFAVYVLPRHERKVARVLACKGIEHFLPTIQARHKWSDRMKVVDLPLFPGYLFCRIDSRFLGPVLSVMGVAHIVNFGGKPAPVPETDIHMLQTIGRSDIEREATNYLHTGERVEVISGPLSGVCGLLAQIKNRDRLVLSVDLICRSVAVEVDLASVVPVRKAA
jgi:transcription termination/antitermination protein NusG